MRTFTKLADIIEKSVNYPDGNECQEYPCDVTLVESFDDDSKPVEFLAYTVVISHRNITFYCDNGCLDYVIDNYGGGDELILMTIGE